MQNSDDEQYLTIIFNGTIRRLNMMFEHYKQPLLIFPLFIRRVIRCAMFSLLLIGVTVIIGAFALYYIELGWSWPDAFLNSILIMTGCGLNKTLMLSGSKIFMSFYAICSTIIYFCVLIILFAPLVHRLLHSFHLEIESNKSTRKKINKQDFF